MYLLFSRIFCEVTCCKTHFVSPSHFKTDYVLLGCTQGFSNECSKSVKRFCALAMNWHLPAFFFFFFDQNGFSQTWLCSAFFTALTFARVFVSCACFFSNSCVHATFCSLSKISFKRSFHLHVNKVDRSRLQVTSAPRGGTDLLFFLGNPLDISVSCRKSLGFSAF